MTWEPTEAETRQILEMAERGLGAMLAEAQGAEQHPEGTAPVTEAERELAGRVFRLIAPEGAAPVMGMFGIPPAISQYLGAQFVAGLDPILIWAREPANREAIGESLVEILAELGRDWGWDEGAVADAVRDSGPWGPAEPELPKYAPGEAPEAAGA